VRVGVFFFVTNTLLSCPRSGHARRISNHPKNNVAPCLSAFVRACFLVCVCLRLVCFLSKGGKGNQT
jgi:hypothetical protein